MIGMTKMQDLAYRRMLEASWELGPLPCEPDDLARLIDFSPREFERAWRFPLTDCWKVRRGRLTNARLESERKVVAKIHEISVKQGG